MMLAGSPPREQSPAKPEPKEIWKRSSLMIIALVHRFIYKVRRAVIFINTGLMNGLQLEAIMDAAA